MINILVTLIVLISRSADGLFIERCPLYGCRPSGTFSMYLNITQTNASIAWKTKFPLDPVPRPLGCVANDVSIICLSNDPTKDANGYDSLETSNGAIRWRDKILKFPTLPLLNNYGDVTGSDGTNLVHYDANGKLYPKIPCEGLKPLISLQLVGTDFLLLVSGTGLIVARETNGVPVGYMKLNYVIEGIKGTFIPTSRTVANGNRFYLLTKFVPADCFNDGPSLQRLFAVDIHHSLDNRITVAWYYDITKPNQRSNDGWGKKDKGLQNQCKNEEMYEKQVLMWDSINKLIYVNLAQKAVERKLGLDCLFWALKDSGNHSSLLYCKTWDIAHMSKFELNSGVQINEKNAHSKNYGSLWLITANGYLYALNNNGAVLRTIALQSVLGIAVNITSKVVLAKPDDDGPDTLIFAIETGQVPQNKIHVSKPHSSVTDVHVFREHDSAFSFVIAVNATIDTEDSTNNESNDKLILWMVPVPENMRVRGQISGSGSAETQRKNEIILYAEGTGKSAVIFAIH